LFLHHYAAHDRDQPWGGDPGGLQAVIAGVSKALAGAGGRTRPLSPGPSSRGRARRFRGSARSASAEFRTALMRLAVARPARPASA